MISHDRHLRMDAARTRAELSVQELWLRYLALGGTSDAFELDGYLQGLMPLDAFQEDVLAQSVNEALKDSYDCYNIPLIPIAADGSDERLRSIIARLLDEAPVPPADNRPRGDDDRA